MEAVGQFCEFAYRWFVNALYSTTAGIRKKLEFAEQRQEWFRRKDEQAARSAK